MNRFTVTVDPHDYDHLAKRSYVAVSILIRCLMPEVVEHQESEDTFNMGLGHARKSVVQVAS